MSTTETQREQEQVVGVLTGVVQKGADKWQAVVQPDNSQYTRNLWTKDLTQVNYLSSQIGNRIGFLCNVSHWTNQSGQPIRSLWIEQVGGAPAAAPMQAPVAPPAQPVVVQPQVTPMQGYSSTQPPLLNAPVQQQGTPDLREKKIHRQTATKVAALLLAYLPSEEQTITTLLTLSDRLCAYYDNGLPQAETIDDLVKRAMPSGMDEPGQPYAGDDDIPF